MSAIAAIRTFRRSAIPSSASPMSTIGSLRRGPVLSRPSGLQLFYRQRVAAG
jgi:hypothetical protein